MSAREAILARLRRGARRMAAHPGEHPAPQLQPAAGFAPFAEALRAAGGAHHGPLPRERLAAKVREIAARRAPQGRVLAEPSAAALLGPGPWETPAPDAAGHGFEDAAITIALGQVGCAENAAVLVTGRDAPHRALLFLCRHLLLLLPLRAIVSDFHSALAALPPDALAHHHCTWICGPSKTADIEQTLVQGAHGPLSLDVLAVAPGRESGAQ